MTDYMKLAGGPGLEDYPVQSVKTNNIKTGCNRNGCYDEYGNYKSFDEIKDTAQNVAQMSINAQFPEAVRKEVQVKVSFEDKARGTIEYLGDTWGYGFLFILIISGLAGRKFLFDLFLKLRGKV